MDIIIAIDPGTSQSAIIEYDVITGGVLYAEILENNVVLDYISINSYGKKHLVIEMLQNYGMAVGKTTFETCVWIGRFMESCHENTPISRLYRKQRWDGYEGVCMHMCHNNRAKDTNIKQAVMDIYPPTGGGKTPQVGTKSQPGPLFGIKKDLWQALGVAITFADQVYGEPK